MRTNEGAVLAAAPLKGISIIAHKYQKGKRTEGVVHLKKMGRPLKAKTNLSHDVKVRLDDETYERLCLYCESTGKERAAVLREGLQKYLDTSEKEIAQ